MKTKTDIKDRFVVIMAGGRGEGDLNHEGTRMKSNSQLLIGVHSCLFAVKYL